MLFNPAEYSRPFQTRYINVWISTGKKLPMSNIPLVFYGRLVDRLMPGKTSGILS
jgi:hypothetical protein